tara:strand:- start:157 stop:477 length:321 start_codon:yes stop_codon:yes gene_type:complete
MGITTKNPNSCFIELVPRVDKDYWTGELEVNIIASEKSKLSTESKSSLIHLCQLVASTVALMERDPSLTERLEDFLDEADEALNKRNKPKVKSVQGNVISLSFKGE